MSPSATPRRLRRRHNGSPSTPYRSSPRRSPSSLTKASAMMAELFGLESASGEGRRRRRGPVIVVVGLLALPIIIQLEGSASILSSVSIYQRRSTQTVSLTTQSLSASDKPVNAQPGGITNRSSSSPGNMTQAQKPPAKKEEETLIPLCYSSRASRFRPLQGDWKATPAPPLYWKLSCPMEWSKFSCSHHKEVPERARESARTRFIPRDCSFGSESTSPALRVPRKAPSNHHENLEHLARLLRGRRILLFGDSLIRQVMMSWGCLLHSRLQQVARAKGDGSQNDGKQTPVSVSFEVDWMDCAKGQRWRCWNSTRCVPCGPRSGAFNMAIVLTDGSDDALQNTSSSHHQRNASVPWINATATENSAVITQGSLWSEGDSLAGLQMSPRDIVVVQAGVHGTADRSITNAIIKIAELIHDIDKGVIVDEVSSGNRKMPNIIHMVTWSQHYPTPNGAFNRPFLTNHTRQTGSKQCVDSVGDHRFQKEMKALNVSFMDCDSSNGRAKPKKQRCQRRTLLSYLSGVLWLDGINSRGRSKVGSHVGEFGDCTHFCMPGPTDDVAKALELMIYQILLEEENENAGGGA